MPKVQLASQRLNTPSSPGLSNSLLSASAGGKFSTGGRIQAPTIRAGNVNVNAGQVRYRGPDAPAIQDDTLTTALKAGGEFTGKLQQSAFAYSQRQDQVVAQYNSLELDRELRDMYYGTPGADGSVQGGYGNTKELEASQGYGGYQDGIKQRMAERMENMTPQQRQFAATSFHNTANGYLNKGAKHATTQLGAAQESITNSTFSETMMSMQTDIATGESVDLTSMQNSLAMFTDPAARKTRDTEMTKSALNATFIKDGPAAAMDLAEVMAATPGVGDPTVLNEFINSVKSNQRDEDDANRARMQIEQARKKLLKEENNNMVTSVITEHAAPSIVSGNFGETITYASEKYTSDVAREKIPLIINDAMQQQWDNAKDLNPVGGTAVIAEQIEQQLKDIPPEYRDDVRRKLKELKADERKEKLAELKQIDDIHDTEIALESNVVQDGIAELAQIVEDGGTIDDAKANALYYDSAATDTQRLRIDRLRDGTVNPNLTQELGKIEENWEDVVANPQLLAGYDISEPKRIELQKRARTDRVTGAAQFRKNGIAELKQMFSLKDTGGGAFSFVKGSNDTDVSEQQVLAAYQSALSKYNSIADSELRPDKNNAPGAAIQIALQKIYADETLRPMMKGLPKTTTGTGVKEEQKVYADDHTQALQLWAIPAQIPGLKGPASPIAYAQMVEKEQAAKGELGQDPRMLVNQRIVETYDALNAMMGTAQTVPEQVEIQRLIKNVVGQHQYLRELRPSSQAGFEKTETVTGSADADTPKVKTAGGEQRVRSTNLDAEEMSIDGKPNPEGIAQKEKMDRARQAISGSGVYSFKYEGGLGKYGRPVGQGHIGSADLGVIAREELGIDPYYKETP